MYSSFWQMKGIEKKSSQTLVSDPGGYSSRLRECPFLGGQRALLRRGGSFRSAMISEARAFLVVGGLENVFFLKTGGSLRRTYCG